MRPKSHSVIGGFAENVAKLIHTIRNGIQRIGFDIYDFRLLAVIADRLDQLHSIQAL